MPVCVLFLVFRKDRVLYGGELNDDTSCEEGIC